MDILPGGGGGGGGLEVVECGGGGVGVRRDPKRRTVFEILGGLLLEWYHFVVVGVGLIVL